MITGSTRATDITMDKMKIALVGEYKVGKDWLANTAPGTIFSFDFDDRKDSLAKHPNRANIEVKTYYDTDPLKPTQWPQFESDVCEFQEMARKGEKIPDWFVLSSMQYCGDCCMNWILLNNPGMRQEVRENKQDKQSKIISYQPFGWEPYTAVTNAVENNVNALHSIGNLICCFHEMPEKDIVNSTPKNPVYTGKYQVYPNYLKKLLSIFNDQWRLIVFGGSRKVVTGVSDSQFIGATSLSVDDEEEPNITKMLEKHSERLKNGKK